MSLFEPKTVCNIIKATIPEAGKRREFEQWWSDTVKHRKEKWMSCRDGRLEAQLEWEANITVYIQYVYKLTSVHGNAKKGTKPPPLDARIPILGPRFIPPTYLCVQKRSALPTQVTPDITYLKPLNVVHPFYYPKLLAVCPRCESRDVLWDDWTATGHRVVHSLWRDETALGYQLRCTPCLKQYGGKRVDGQTKEPFCFATTSDEFWKGWEYWKMPRGIPVFFKRSALTRELVDFIVELRPSVTSKGLAENIKQLHLLEYQKTCLEYLRTFEAREINFYSKCSLQQFSEPGDLNGYANKPITADLITDVVLQYNERTRARESREWMTTLTAITISLDNTFKVVGKATVASKKPGLRVKMLKGGVLSCINERNEIISWRMCETKSNRELGELLEGIVRRCEALGIELPISAIFDNCCQVAAEVARVLMDTHVGLDVRHFKERYLSVIFGGMRNRHRTAVGNDIVDAILKTRAQDSTPATYYNREEQAVHLQSVWEKYERIGGVWTEAAAQVHCDQMAHVRKGCLTRPRDDIAADGSRIEGSHKGWNSIMRAHPSGIEVFSALADDFVHRRNLRTAHRLLLTASEAAGGQPLPLSFTTFTYGTHHTRLVDYIAGVWNTLVNSEPSGSESNKSQKLVHRPRLLSADSNEQFGLAPSLLTIPGAELIEFELAKQEDEDLGLDILQDLTIDPVLVNSPAGSTDLKPATSDSAAIVGATSTSALIRVTGDNIDAYTENMSQAVPTPPVVAGKRKAIEQVDSDETGAKRVCTAKSGTTPFSAIAAAAPRPANRVIGDWFKSYIPHVDDPVMGSIASSAKVTLTMPTSPPNPPSSSQSTSDISESAYVKTFGPPVIANMSTNTPTITVPDLADAPNLADMPNLADASVLTDTSFRAGAPVHNDAPAPIDMPVAANVPAAAANAPALMNATVVGSASLMALSSPLPLPTEPGLTRSQAFFARATGVDPRSLSFDGEGEFFLFMDMRHELQWAMFKMTATQTTLAVSIYNSRLWDQNKARQLPTVIKQPRAFLDKLASTEMHIRDRVETGNYKSRRSGREEFWRLHCGAVPLQKPVSGKAKTRESRCKRCGIVRFVGGVGSDQNHKLHYCSDGARSTVIRGAGPGEAPPPWPQPAGVFTNGQIFHPIKFLQKVHELYSLLVVGQATTSDSKTPGEDEAFAKMVGQRVRPLPDGRMGFRLYAHTVQEPQLPAGYVVPGTDGLQYLRLDCLSDPQPAPL